MTIKSIYETRVCAFIDVLGFADAVVESAKDSEQATRLHSALQVIAGTTPAWQSEGFERFVDNWISDQLFGDGAPIAHDDLIARYRLLNRGTIFSDSIVLSASPAPVPIWAMVFKIAALAQNLARLGLLVRGGVATGELFHSTDQVFGPAFVDAYRIESQVAIYPRIVVAPSCLPQFEAEGPSNGLHLRDYLRTDFDGLSHIDVFSTHLMSAMIDRSAFGKHVQNNFDELSQREKDLSVFAKLRWYCMYLEEKFGPNAPST